MDKKVLYISYDGMTDPLGQSQVLPYLAGLTTQGYQFTLISFEKKARFEKESKIIDAIVRRTGITWVPLMYTKNPPVLSKIYDRWRLRRAALRLYKEQKFDMVHCRSYVAAEMGLWMKKKFGTKFLFDMRGFWADEKVDNGQWNTRNPFFRRVYKHYKALEKKFLQQADGIVSLTESAKKELLKNHEYNGLAIDVIPCCADLEHFNYNHIKKDFSAGLREQAGISSSDKVITYMGSIGGWYMTKEMFSFFNRLLLKYPEFILLILTKDEPNRVRKEAEESGVPLEKIRVLYAGRNELPDYISLSDCSIFFIRPTYSKIASSPTKHAELMGMGIPVICNDIGDTGHVIEASQTGLIVREFTTGEYDRVIDRMPELLAISKEHIRRAAFEYFDLEKGAGDYLQIYKRVLQD